MNITRPKHEAPVRGIATGKVFAGADRRQQERLAQLATTVKVPAGRVLTEQGRPGREFGVIVEGEAVVEIDGVEVARLGAGDHYGEIALLEDPLTGRGCRATVTTTTDTTLAAMSVSEFRTLLDDMPVVENRLLRTAFERTA